MKLQTNRLFIVPLTKEDIPDIHRMNSFEEVARYNTIGIPKSEADTAKVLTNALDASKENERILGWVLQLKDGNTFIGQLGMNRSIPKYNMAEIHYHLLPDYWGKGYATEAVMELLRWGFEDMKLHRIEAGVATANTASIKLLERVGMQREGLRRKILPIRGEWQDNYMYAILDEDWNS
ncbi:GNAT family protein [Aureisphaera galaxeae]|uniref:GNAT family N-acetyltransferase n=1 Tax=Aureisphaera galaxeae TaxID=1538023 RepID=UPI00234FC8B2|nr:GNAT family protein [Aureisphaera galaxeae]MDC8002966.1 GNAT family protein [Aureisphaera galaxeae]